MDDGIGEGLTRPDHEDVANQMYAAYAEGEDLRDLVNIVGREALSEQDNKFLDFADRFEEEFVQQGYETSRSVDETLELGWDLLSMLPKEALNRIDQDLIEKHYREDDSELVETTAD